MYTHLHWHSHYSLLEAVWTPARIVEKAKSLWMNSIAITDIAWLYWAIEFYEVAKKEWIKAIIWVELNLIDNNNNIEWQCWQNLVIIAKNYEWYKNLLKLVSYSHIKWYDQRPNLDINYLKENSSNLIWFMWWENSFIWKMILQNDNNELIKEKLISLKNLFNWDFYLEIVAQDENIFENIKKINNYILEISKEIWIKNIINNVFSYINKEDKNGYEVLLSIKEWKIYHWEKLKWEYHIMSEKEIILIMKKNWYNENIINEMIQNNTTISDSINLEINLWSILFPKYESSDKIKELYKKI